MIIHFSCCRSLFLLLWCTKQCHPFVCINKLKIYPIEIYLSCFHSPFPLLYRARQCHPSSCWNKEKKTTQLQYAYPVSILYCSWFTMKGMMFRPSKLLASSLFLPDVFSNSTIQVPRCLIFISSSSHHLPQFDLAFCILYFLMKTLE